MAAECWDGGDAFQSDDGTCFVGRSVPIGAVRSGRVGPYLIEFVEPAADVGLEVLGSGATYGDAFVAASSRVGAVGA